MAMGNLKPPIPALRGMFAGGADYDRARTVVGGTIDRHPAVILRAANANEVSQVISVARGSGLELAVRRGGHSATEGGILLDLSRMKDLQIDVDQKTARAETGLTAVEYTTATAAHYEKPEDKPTHETWVSAFVKAIQQNDAGTHVNFLGEVDEAQVRAAYPGRTWGRLAAIKARYDPENSFRLNQNIPPGG